MVNRHKGNLGEMLIQSGALHVDAKVQKIYIREDSNYEFLFQSLIRSPLPKKWRNFLAV